MSKRINKTMFIKIFSYLYTRIAYAINPKMLKMRYIKPHFLACFLACMLFSVTFTFAKSLGDVTNFSFRGDFYSSTLLCDTAVVNITVLDNTVPETSNNSFSLDDTSSDEGQTITNSIKVKKLRDGQGTTISWVLDSIPEASSTGVDSVIINENRTTF